MRMRTKILTPLLPSAALRREQRFYLPARRSPLPLSWHRHHRRQGACRGGASVTPRYKAGGCVKAGRMFVISSYFTIIYILTIIIWSHIEPWSMTMVTL